MPECHRTRTRHSGSPIRHSREGGNPRTNIPRKNANRDTTTYVHPSTPLRLSGESTPRTPIRRRNPKGRGRCQFSYLGVPAPAGMSDWYESMFRTPIRDDVTRPRLCPYTTAPPLVVPAPQASFRRRPQSSGAGMRKCSAVEDYARRGACPPLGSGWGVAESAAPTRRTKSQLRLLIPWCAGDSRDERLVRTLSGDANRYSRRATKAKERKVALRLLPNHLPAYLWSANIQARPGGAPQGPCQKPGLQSTGVRSTRIRMPGVA